MPRYVILRHELPPESERPSHYDLMFDTGATLRTWAIELSPDAPDEQIATALPDHRREYLTYEGPVSGNRGSVTRWDEGEYELTAEAADLWQARVAGLRLQGTIRIIAGGFRYAPANFLDTP